jgi:hypothetical protein
MDISSPAIVDDEVNTSPDGNGTDEILSPSSLSRESKRSTQLEKQKSAQATASATLSKLDIEMSQTSIVSDTDDTASNNHTELISKKKPNKRKGTKKQRCFRLKFFFPNSHSHHQKAKVKVKQSKEIGKINEIDVVISSPEKSPYSGSSCTSITHHDDQNIEIQLAEKKIAESIFVNSPINEERKEEEKKELNAPVQPQQEGIFQKLSECLDTMPEVMKSSITTKSKAEIQKEKKLDDFGKKCSVNQNSNLNPSHKNNAAAASSSPQKVKKGGWFPLEGSNFEVRKGPNYAKKKQKESSAESLYESVHCSAFRSDKRASLNDILSIPNDAAFPGGKIPKLDDETIPHLIIIQYQIPSEQPSILKSTIDGPGAQVALYFVPSKRLCDESNALMKNKNDKNVSGAVKLFREWCAKCEDSKAWRSRFKSIARVRQVNGESGSFLKRFNGQPMLVKESSSVRKGVTKEGIRFIEYNVNMHKWAYVAKKGIVALLPQVMGMTIDFGFTIEARDDSEMPENILASITLDGMDPTEMIKLPEDLHVGCRNR